MVSEQFDSRKMNTRSAVNRQEERPVSNRVEEIEASIGSFQMEIGTLKEKFQSEIGTLHSKMGSIKKMLETILKQGAESPIKAAPHPKSTSQGTSHTSTPTSGSMRNQGGSEGDGINGRGMNDMHRFYAIKGRKLEIPVFDGKDPDGWIMRAERYFKLNHLNDEEQIEVAVISFEGDALRWFQWEHRRQPMNDWKTVKLGILKQFRSCAMGSLCEQFLALKQEGSVDDYRKKFVALAAPLEGISEEIFLGQFINGLDPVVKAELRLLDPINLNVAMDIASKIEEKNKVISKHKQNGNWSGKKGLTTFNDNKTSITVLPKFNGQDSRSASNYRRLTNEELQNKRSQGLCYRCDEKFSPGHVCKMKEISILVTQQTTDDEEEEMEELTEEVIQEAVKEKVEVHLNSVIGFSNPKRMKVEGQIEAQIVVVLIDCGVTHNFISNETVAKLKIPVDKTEKYVIAMGTGMEVNGQGVCRNVKLHIQELEICEEFLPLKLGNSDVILGMQWLVKLA